MAIEFYCPGCGELMSTPDATAGGKGRCPYCQTKVRIPLTSMLKGSTSGVQSIFDFDPNAGSGPTKASAGYILFRCSQCHTDLRIPSTNAGKKGQCPHCSAVMQIPATTAAAAPARSTAAEKKPPTEKWKGAPQPLAAGNLQFSCPRCQNIVQVSAAAAGKRGKCPRCQSTLQIPFSSNPSPSGLQPLGPMPNGLTLLNDDVVNGLTPLDEAVSGLTPLNDTGLTPLGDFGLTPIGDMPAGLESLGPLNTGPYNSMSSGNYAYSQEPASFAGGASGSLNPFASPAAASYAASAPHPVDKRRGLPWDRKGAGMDEFFSTISKVIGEPTEAFKEMKRYGGFGRPLVFSVITGFVGGIGSAVYNFLFGYFDPFDRYPDALQPGIAIAAAIYVFLGTLIGSSAGAFVSAALFHIPVKLFGSVQPYETTFRVICYLNGAIIVFQLIPLLGGCVALGLALVLPTIGLSGAHSISKGKAFAAHMLAVGFCLMTICGLVFFINPFLQMQNR